MVGLLLIPFSYVLCTKRNIITTATFVLITAHLVWRSHYEIGKSPFWWNIDKQSAVTAHIEKHQPSVIVELPFDQSLQFISAIRHPAVARINPWTLNAKPPISNESLHFLYEIGYKRSVTHKPSKEGFVELGLNFVYFDRQRCRKSKSCRTAAKDYLAPVLGTPTTLEDGSLVWKIQ